MRRANTRVTGRASKRPPIHNPIQAYYSLSDGTKRYPAGYRAHLKICLNLYFAMKTKTTRGSAAWLRNMALMLCALTALAASSPELERARERYNRTDYHGSLELLSGLSGGS